LYFAFGILTGLKQRELPDHSAVLEDAGFVLEQEAIASAGLLTSQLWKRKADPSGTYVPS
jgi:hypothetical protein